MCKSYSPTIYLVRHGETEWNKQKRRQGHRDSPLTARGRNQAVENGKRLRRHVSFDVPVAMFSSPLGRAKQTALIVAENLGYSPDSIIFDTRLMECNFGRWEGLTVAEIKRQFAKEWDVRSSDRWNIPPLGGESYADVHARVSSWYADAALDEINLVVCHGLTSRVFRGIYAGLSQQQVFELSETQNGVFELWDGRVSLIE